MWFAGTALIPLLTLFGPYSLNANVFIFTGWLGYFVLGTYLMRVQLKSSLLTLVWVLGLLWTIIGTYLVIATLGEKFSQFFLDAASFNNILLQPRCFCCWLRFQAEKSKTVFPAATACLN